LIFFLVYLLTRSSIDHYIFERSESDYGRFIETRNKEYSKLGRQYADRAGELGFGKVLNVKMKLGKLQQVDYQKRIRLERGNRVVRGYEKWSVFHEHAEN
jgi:hypothetical protein